MGAKRISTVFGEHIAVGQSSEKRTDEKVANTEIRSDGEELAVLSHSIGIRRITSHHITNSNKFEEGEVKAGMLLVFGMVYLVFGIMKFRILVIWHLVAFFGQCRFVVYWPRPECFWYLGWCIWHFGIWM